MSSSFSALPAVLLELCLGWLHADSLCLASGVSRGWLRAASQPQVWRHISSAFGAADVDATHWLMPLHSAGRTLLLSLSFASRAQVQQLQVKSVSASVEWVSSTPCRRFLPLRYDEGQYSKPLDGPGAEDLLLADLRRFGNIRVLSASVTPSESTASATLALVQSGSFQAVEHMALFPSWGPAADRDRDRVEVLQAVLALPRLSSVSVAYAPSSSPSFAAALFAGADRLRSVRLYLCAEKVDSESMSWLRAIPNLTALSLWAGNIRYLPPDQMPPMLSEFALWPSTLGLDQLRRIELGMFDPSRFKPGQLEGCLAALPRLERLGLRDGGLHGLLAALLPLSPGSLPALRTLRYRARRGATDGGLPWANGECSARSVELVVEVLARFPLLRVVIESRGVDWSDTSEGRMADDTPAAVWQSEILASCAGRVTFVSLCTAAVAFTDAPTEDGRHPPASAKWWA